MTQTPLSAPHSYRAVVVEPIPLAYRICSTAAILAATSDNALYSSDPFHNNDTEQSASRFYQASVAAGVLAQDPELFNSSVMQQIDDYERHQPPHTSDLLQLYLDHVCSWILWQDNASAANF